MYYMLMYNELSWVAGLWSLNKALGQMNFQGIIKGSAAIICKLFSVKSTRDFVVLCFTAVIQQ